LNAGKNALEDRVREGGAVVGRRHAGVRASR
jgi:hypothetical protein